MNVGLYACKAALPLIQGPICDEILRDCNGPQGALPAKLLTDRRKSLHFTSHFCEAHPWRLGDYFFPLSSLTATIMSSLTATIMRQDLPLNGHDDGY